MKPCRWLALALSLTCPAISHAQNPAASANAVQLFDEAERLMQAGKVSEACPKYAASMKLDPQLGALLHLADCYEKNAQLASAWGSFRQAADMAQKRGDARLAAAREYAMRLEPRLNRLSLVVAEPTTPQLEVRLDGRLISAGDWNTPSPVDAGTHLVEARAPGHEAWSTSVAIAGERQQARVEVPALRPSSRPLVVESAPPARERGPAVLRTVGWVGVGAGAIGLGVGAAFLAKRHATLDERADACPSLHDCTAEQKEQIDTLTTRARSADTSATVALIVGGALVAGGVTTLIVAARARPQRNTAWLAPVVTPKGAAITGGLRW